MCWRWHNLFNNWGRCNLFNRRHNIFSNRLECVCIIWKSRRRQDFLRCQRRCNLFRCRLWGFFRCWRRHDFLRSWWWGNLFNRRHNTLSNRRSFTHVTWQHRRGHRWWGWRNFFNRGRNFFKCWRWCNNSRSRRCCTRVRWQCGWWHRWQWRWWQGLCGLWSCRRSSAQVGREGSGWRWWRDVVCRGSGGRLDRGRVGAEIGDDAAVEGEVAAGEDDGPAHAEGTGDCGREEQRP